MPSPMLNVLCVAFPQADIVTAATLGIYCYYPHFIEEETKTERLNILPKITNLWSGRSRTPASVWLTYVQAFHHHILLFSLAGEYPMLPPWPQRWWVYLSRIKSTSYYKSLRIMGSFSPLTWNVLPRHFYPLALLMSIRAVPSKSNFCSFTWSTYFTDIYKLII